MVYVPRSEREAAPIVGYLARLPGVSYVTDATGCLLYHGGPEWERALDRNGVDQAARSGCVPGSSVLRAIGDQPTREVFMMIYRVLITGKRRSVRYRYRCDSSTRPRLLRMEISRVPLPDGTPGLLHHSERAARLPAAPIVRQLISSRDVEAPRVTQCSFCQHVCCDSGLARPTWMSLLDYYRGGGPAHVALAYGICTACHAQIVAPLYEIEQRRGDVA